jgi:serine/threonine protein kinase
MPAAGLWQRKYEGSGSEPVSGYRTANPFDILRRRVSSECPNCGEEVPGTSRYCGQCGSPVSRPSASSATKTFAPSPASTRTRSQGRFAPGEVIAGRYQVIDLLGSGGMGEVYRANDLTLQQRVALKFFLPTHVADAPSLERLRKEVRLARQVSHPNVCRVYDIGTAGDQAFLSMEYVDGEDLASLLRRIGRVPPDKGVEIARGLCLGLAAAHQRRVLHRDLKPANVMMDSRG